MTTLPRRTKRPQGIYLLCDRQIDKIYGAERHREIARRVEIEPEPVTAQIYQGSDQSWPDVEVIFSGWGMVPMDEAFLARFPNLKVIFYGAGSVKAFVTDAFWRSGVRVTSAFAANAIPVAEYTCAQIVQALKRSWQTARYIQREGRFPDYYIPPGVYGTTVGLLSLGMVGRLVAERLRAHEVKIVAYDPFVTQAQADEFNVTMVSLKEIFAQADVVSCHTPWLPETERMIRGHHFASMKRDATFLNTARGAVVAEEEMIATLRQRPDLLAILDVTHPEPPVPGSPLYTLENVVLTPHIAGSMGMECRRMGRYMLAELERYLAGEPLLFELNEKQSLIMA